MIVGLVERVDVEHQPATLAANLLVVRLFESALAALFHVNEAENVRGGLVCDVVALHLVDEAQAVEMQGFDLIGLLVRELALDGNQHEVFRREPFVKRITVEVEQVGQPVGHCASVFDLGRRGVKRPGFDRARHLVAVAVVDDAAHRTEIDCRLLLMLGARPQRVVISDLQLDKPIADHHDPEEHQDLNDDESFRRDLVVASHHIGCWVLGIGC